MITIQGVINVIGILTLIDVFAQLALYFSLGLITA
jgi:hypothetical protein